MSCPVVHSGYCIGDVYRQSGSAAAWRSPGLSLYTAELFDVIAECSLTGHTYADDTQVYISTPATDHVDAMDRLAACIERIRDWMANNHLKLNEEKTQIIWLGTHQQVNKVMTRALTLPNATVEFSATVKDHGVVLDSQLTMADHIAALSRSCFFHIRQLRSIRQSLHQTQ